MGGSSKSSDMFSVIFIMIFINLTAEGAGASTLSTTQLPRCNGTIGECMEAEGGSSEEFLMESEVSHRILASSTGNSYDSLKKPPPCDASIYLDCNKYANPGPNRGCYYCKRSPRG
ncbi:unnamed protein product [Rhodiola kirilowii]